MAEKSTSRRTGVRPKGFGAGALKLLRIGSCFSIDVALLVTAALMLTTDMAMFFFYSIFFWLVLGAFLWGFRAFVLRAGIWTSIASAGVALALLMGDIRPGEIIGLPFLASILALVLVGAWRWSENRRVAWYESFGADAHVSEQGLEDDLRLAVERNELEVYYQPTVSLESGRITEIEALVWWNHPKHGPISPTKLISLAEKTGLILAIERWVLYEACRQTREWHDRFESPAPLLVSVNLSATQFQEPDLVRSIVGTLRQTGLQASSLQLEIAESVLTEDVDLALQALRELREAGVQSVIDDFGKGFSSLNYLKSLSVDTLKVDRSLIERLGEGAEDTAVVQLIANLAHTLGLQVAAEGIETVVQVKQLRETGFDLGQGPYFSRPLPAPKASALLARNTHARHLQEQFRR